MKKKSNGHNDIWNKNSDFPKCDDKQCNRVGEYFAPKSPGSNEKYTFCLEHIKAYNKRWNYFAGKSQSEIYEFQKNDFLENRPTQPFSKGKTSKIKFEFNYFFDKSKMKFKKKNKKIEKEDNLIKNYEIRNALIIMGIKEKITEYVIKKKYKELVKKYHPDLNKNSISKEIKIREINKAYKILTKYLKENYASK